jgi:hypothetical protein
MYVIRRGLNVTDSAPVLTFRPFLTAPVLVLINFKITRTQFFRTEDLIKTTQNHRSWLLKIRVLVILKIISTRTGAVRIGLMYVLFQCTRSCRQNYQVVCFQNRNSINLSILLAIENSPITTTSISEWISCVLNLHWIHTFVILLNYFLSNIYLPIHMFMSSWRVIKNGWMAEWSKALVLGTSLRAGVRIPLQSQLFAHREKKDIAT